MIKYFNQSIIPNFEIENSYNYKIIAGIDEAGRGPLCAPVFSASVVILDKTLNYTNINDSKKITEEKRENIFNEILELEKNNKILFEIGEASVEEIDNINIRNATKLAMQRSYNNLVNKYNIKPELVLVDGNFIPDINTKAEYIIKGDQKSISIAMASIIAKVSRDRLIRSLHLEYPQYDWVNNKGYGTAKHIEAIKKYGLCKYHRKTFTRKFI